ncbi:MAG: ATP-binding protein [Firmicutes bacterium]|nr:ATP-binding protein [Bacillota bacterium]
MARGELLRKLFLSYRRGNDNDFRSVAIEIISEEEKKNNHHLAKDLFRILENDNVDSVNSRRFSYINSTSLPKDQERQTHLVDIREPNLHMQDILINKENTVIIQRILKEFSKSELLRVHGMKPLTKLLFCGPPGCGKTLCSEIIASELGLPVLYTRFDAIVSSYLGETAANLRRVFDYAAGGRWVVFFDEFDAIGKARDDISEHGELKRVINSFLQLLDSFSNNSILIAATNHEQLLDPALWRRFDEVMFFPRPTVHEIRSLLKMKVENFPHYGLNYKELAPKFKGLSHADVERVCFDAIKASILDDKDSLDQEVLEEALKRQKKRLDIAENASKRRKI